MAGRNKKLDERRTDADEQNNTGVAGVDEGGELSSDGSQSGVNITIHNGNSKPEDGKLAKGGDEKPVETKPVESKSGLSIEDDRKRAKEIRELGRKHGASQELIDKACDDGLSVKNFGLLAFQEKTKDVPPPRDIELGRDLKREVAPTVLSAGVRVASGIKLGKADQELYDKNGGKPITGLHALARAACALEGKSLPWSHTPNDLLSAAISTSSFPEALSDSFNKSLHAGYELAPRVFLDVFGRKPVRDFKEAKDIKLSSFSRPAEISGGEELPYVNFSETKETYALGTKGFIFTLTRKMWINDDMGIFTDIPNKLGYKMGDEFDQQGYEFLTQAAGVGPTMQEDSNPLFHAGRTTPNYFTGTGSAFKESAVEQAATGLMKIKHGEDYLNLMPDVVLVPPALYFSAKRLLQSTTLIAGTNLTSTELEGSSNAVAGLARVMMSPRLTGATNGSTAWYMLANQRVYPSMVAVTLNGVETPTVEEVELPPTVLGRGWRCYFDMAWGVVDWRSIVRNKGA